MFQFRAWPYYRFFAITVLLPGAEAAGQLANGYVTKDKNSGDIIEIVYRGSAEWLARQEDPKSHLHKLPKLKYLTLVGHNITLDQMKYVATLQHLKGLDIGSVTWGLPEDEVTIDDDSLCQIGRMTWLEELEVNTSGLNDKDWEFLRRCKSLKSLMIDGDLTVSDQFFRSAMEGKSLERLEVRSTGDFSDDAFATVAGMRSLKSLHIRGLPRLTDRGAQVLSELSDLESLHLGGKTNLTTSTVERLTSLRNLRELSLEVNQVSTTAMAGLAQMPRLQVLSISPAGVGDEGIAVFRGHPSIMRLYLPGARITSRSVEVLRSLMQLEVVSFGGDDDSKRLAETINKELDARKNSR